MLIAVCRSCLLLDFIDPQGNKPSFSQPNIVCIPKRVVGRRPGRSIHRITWLDSHVGCGCFHGAASLLGGCSGPLALGKHSYRAAAALSL